MPGHIAAIYISPDAGVLPHSVPRARALAGRGLEGDRYALGCGTFSANSGPRDITLIEAETLEQFTADHGHSLGPAESRRNLITRGVRLNDLVGCEFQIG